MDRQSQPREKEEMKLANLKSMYKTKILIERSRIDEVGDFL
jgi:hypothetical protein